MYRVIDIVIAINTCESLFMVSAKNCNFVKARHILAEKQGKITDVYREIRETWLDEDKKVPGPKFGELAAKYSEV
jgi:hypothetical protein